MMLRTFRLPRVILLLRKLRWKLPKRRLLLLTTIRRLRRLLRMLLWMLLLRRL
jgi:hypothetical protein